MTPAANAPTRTNYIINASDSKTRKSHQQCNIQNHWSIVSLISMIYNYITFDFFWSSTHFIDNCTLTHHDKQQRLRLLLVLPLPSCSSLCKAFLLVSFCQLLPYHLISTVRLWSPLSHTLTLSLSLTHSLSLSHSLTHCCLSLSCFTASPSP